MKSHLHKNLVSLLLLASTAFGSPFHLCGQTLDSLEQVLSTGKLNNAEKIDVYKDLALGYINDDPSRSKSFSTEGLILAKEAGDRKSESVFLYYLGSSYYVSTVYDSAAFYFDKTLALARQNKDEDGEVSIL